MQSKKRLGFTLVELLVVIAIIAVISTVSIVGYTSFIEKSTVSTDSQLLTQLNNFKSAYEIAHVKSFTKEDVSKMLIEAEVHEINLQSEKYGYAIYFDTDSNRFELLKISEADENTSLYKLPSQIEDDGDNNDEDNKPTDVVFTINTTYHIEENDLYAKYDSNAQKLNVGISVEKIYDDYNNYVYNYVCKYISVDLTELIGVTEGHIISYSCQATNNIISYPEYEIEDFIITTDPDTGHVMLELHKIGSYILSYTSAGKEEQMNISVFNVKYGDAQITLGYHLPTIKKNSESFDLHFQNLITLNDWYINNHNKYIDNQPLNDLPILEKSTIISDGRIKILLGETELTIIKSSDNNYYVSLGEYNQEKYSREIRIMYQGYNGVWTSLDLKIDFRISSSGQVIDISVEEIILQ